MPADGRHLDDAAAAEHRQADAVPGREVVGGHGPGRLDGDVEARAAARGGVALAQVTDRVEDDAHLGVLVGVRRGDVEGAGAQGDRPVDAAQPVAGAERPDVGELGAAPRPRPAVLPDEADGVGEPGPRGEGARGRHGGDGLGALTGQVHAKEAKSPNAPTWAGPSRRTPQRSRRATTATGTLGPRRPRRRRARATGWSSSSGRPGGAPRRPQPGDGEDVDPPREAVALLATWPSSRLVTVGVAVGRVTRDHTTSADERGADHREVTRARPRPRRRATSTADGGGPPERPGGGAPGRRHDERTAVRGVGTVRSRSATIGRRRDLAHPQLGAARRPGARAPPGRRP